MFANGDAPPGAERILCVAAALDNLRLSADWPGSVTPMQTILGSGIPDPDDLAPVLEPAGFRQDGGLWRYVP